MKEEEVVLEEHDFRNQKMIDVLNKVLDFNSEYTNFLKGQLEQAKKLKSEMENNNG